jgi:methyl-accepting chemotaxis protein
MPQKTKPYLSLRYKLLIPLMMLGAIMFVAGYFGAREYLRSTIYRIMGEEIDSIREYVVNCLDENELQALTSENIAYDESAGWPDGMTDPRYWRQQACLDSVYDFTDRAEIFTYYKVDENTLAYGIDQWATLVPEESYMLGEEIFTDGSEEDDYDDLVQGLSGIHYYDELKYEEVDDIYYYAVTSPLTNSNGVVIGGLSIYLDASWTVESLQEVSNYLVLIFSVIFIVIGVLVLGITRNVTSELVALQAKSKRVAEGDYAPIELRSHRFNDEVSTLGELFNTMLDKVRQREETLQTQVEELKIQIDLEKRNKDVKQIVESEFFQDLKQKAAEVRKQRTQKE